MEEGKHERVVRGIQLSPEVPKHTPLLLDDIARWDGEKCLTMLKERYDLSKDSLFSRKVSDNPDVMWNVGELAKMFLFYLEGASLSFIDLHFSSEFESLRRKDVQYEYGTRYMALQIARNFSPVALETAQQRRYYLRMPEALYMEGASTRKVIDAIMQRTTLSFKELFTGKPFPPRSVLQPVDVLRAFLWRLDGHTTKAIVERFYSEGPRKTLNNPDQLLSFYFSQLFSKQARDIARKSVKKT